MADICEKTDGKESIRTIFWRRAVTSLEGQIIIAVSDIKLFKLGDLEGVEKAPIEMLKEFIETGKIEKLKFYRELGGYSWPYPRQKGTRIRILLRKGVVHCEVKTLEQ
jgi:DNA polymerase/3'-5' exonuclease PolX